MRVDSLTLHQLQIFAAIAREGSFTKAAHSLLLSEPTISQQMGVLERATGAKLFVRASRRPAQLTDAGRRFLATCETVLQELETSLQALDAFNRAEAGHVSFGAATSFCAYLLPALYASFRDCAPGIAVGVEIGSRQNLIDGLISRRLDLAVINGAVDVPHLESAWLAALDLVLVGPPGHRLAVDDMAPFHALAPERLIFAGPSSPARSAIERVASDLGMRLLVWEGGNVEAAVNAVNTGLGIALVPFYAVAPRIATGALAILNVENFPMRSGSSIAWPAGELSAATLAFRDHLLSQQQYLTKLCLFHSLTDDAQLQPICSGTPESPPRMT